MIRGGFGGGGGGGHPPNHHQPHQSTRHTRACLTSSMGRDNLYNDDDDIEDYSEMDVQQQQRGSSSTSFCAAGGCLVRADVAMHHHVAPHLARSGHACCVVGPLPVTSSQAGAGGNPVVERYATWMLVMGGFHESIGFRNDFYLWDFGLKKIFKFDFDVDCPSI